MKIKLYKKLTCSAYEGRTAYADIYPVSEGYQVETFKITPYDNGGWDFLPRIYKSLQSCLQAAQRQKIYVQTEND